MILCYHIKENANIKGETTMKRILALALALVLVFALTACGKQDKETKDMTDLQYIQDKGKLVVGITEFEPMDYKDADGNWIGFDADMATAFAKSLGVDVEFIEIDWDNKAAELDGKAIDCVWNGMTLTDEVTSAMDCTNPYCSNRQVVVVKKDVADKYTTAEACKELTFAVEAGSAGAAAAEAAGFTNVTEVKDQATALSEIAAGTSDAAIIDLTMAKAMTGEGTDYANIVSTVELTSEDYGVGFRKGSDLVSALNDFFKSNYDDMKKAAEKYGISDILAEQK